MKLHLLKILFLFIFQGVFTQNIVNNLNDLKFKHFTSFDGLSQRSVTSILQNKKGYLWFGTRDGLNKFDGVKFNIYRHNLSDTTSLSHNNIHTLFEDSYGNLWVGSHNGLNKYNPEKDNFVRYKSSNSKNTISGNIIWGITQLSNDLWTATNNGISIINIKTNKITNLKKLENNSNSLSDNSTRSFLKINETELWICNTKYIDVYNIKNKSFKRLEYPKSKSNKIHIYDLPTLFLDSHNIIWLGYENGLAFFDKTSETFVDYSINNNKIVNSATRSICEDLLGNLWVGTYSGLYIINAERLSVKHIVHDEDNDASLSQNSIYKIIRDSRGDMWIGTWADGVNYYNSDNGAFKTISFGNNTRKLNYKVVSGITEDENQNLWIGTEGGGLNFYNRELQKFTYYKNNPNNINSLSANNVKSVIKDKQGNIWIGIHDGGLNFLNPNKKPFKFKKIDFENSTKLSLKGYNVLSLLEDKNGNIWIGTLTGGVIVYNIKTKKLLKLDNDIKTIMCITQTDDPNYLLLGGDNGLEKININTKKRIKISIKTDINKEFASLYVNCIFIDNYNNYWIGTEGQGMYIYDPKRKETKRYGIKEGMPNDIIYGILSDDNGNIWASTNYGLSKLNIQSGNIINYNQSDGLQGNEFNYGSFFKTQKKELFFGGTNGLTYFVPTDIRKNTYIPVIDIINIEVNNKPYLKITDSISKITLNHNENDFSIDFTALSFMQSGKNKFSYKLEGRDKVWNNNGNLRKAVYTNIDEGNYVFKVKGSNNDGVWNELGDSISIKILPAPWKTSWAYFLYLSFGITLSLYIRKLILLRIKEKNELKLQKLEKERLEEVNQMKFKLFTDVSHEFRTPLTLIIGPLEKMINENLGDEYIKQQHNTMHRSAKMLLQLINQILDFRKSESGKLRLRASKKNIIPFIKDIKESFKSLADQKNINYQFNFTKKNISVWFDEIKIKKILFNLLSNAFKFTKDNNDLIINVHTTQKNEDSKLIKYVVIDIINFVSVIPEEHIKLIFDRFYQLDQQNMNGSSGIGLSLTKSLIELHKGDIQVTSSSDEGTCFSVFLKLGKDHLSEEELIENTEKSIDESFSYDYLNFAEQQHLTNSQEGVSLVKTDKNLSNILIVEDNKDVQNFIKEIFINKYNIFLAENGEVAIEVTNKTAIDLIISDVKMPKMDGFELCKKIKTTLNTSHIPVILLTAKTNIIHQETGFEIGADAYITKPFKANILTLRVDNLLKSRENLILKFKKEIILEPKEISVTSADDKFLLKAIDIVEQNITNPDFNAHKFTEQMNLSRTVLYSKLKNLTGQNLSTFIRMIRLKRAGQLLVNTKLNVSQIAFEVGFNDLKYFRKCFKDLFESPPSEYRKQMKK